MLVCHFNIGLLFVVVVIELTILNGKSNPENLCKIIVGDYEMMRWG